MLKEEQMKILQRNTLIVAFALGAIFILSCVTVNVYFPESEVEEAADKIVKEVWEKKEKPKEKQDQKPKVNKPESLLRGAFLVAAIMFSPLEAQAQTNINVSTPEITELKNAIADRAPSLWPFLDSGHIGIGKNGLLVLRSGDGLDLQEKASLNHLITQENNDRNALYREIVSANRFAPERFFDIQEIFAVSWRNQARNGWWIQEANGRWSQKSMNMN
jgi:uncharacterized protein YdbL (DUF1318 family)